jgi:predicted ester cyclase
MSKARQAADGIMNAFESHNPQAAKQWVTADFKFIDSTTGQTLSADEWLGATQAMQAAFPDLTYNFEVVQEEGNQVWVRNNFEGTHSADWDLSRMGMGTLPATGKHIASAFAVTVGTTTDAGKATSIEVVEAEPGSGIMGVLQQLGVKLG